MTAATGTLHSASPLEVKTAQHICIGKQSPSNMEEPVWALVA
ncbi:hypothetical protein [uncultured Tateyamaria sp.]|nr:hypothetical protein [uncultured Tateyamaria sp.]